MKKITIALTSLVGCIFIVFLLELGGLQWSEYFNPKHENVKRKVFEQTQSYVLGKRQDLANYFRQYQGEDEAGKKSIEQLIGMQFADFPADKINNIRLRQFLIQTRGF